MQRSVSPFVRIGLVFAALAPASLAQIDVAICAAANSTATACQFTDVQSKLQNSGFFNLVDIINASTTTPSLTQLQQYDAVIVWSNVNFADATLLGDTLADYVDAGGGVVVTVFANSTLSANRWIAGRWQTGYEVVLDQGGGATGLATLGNVLLPSHPVMNGVNSFSGGTSGFRPTSTALEVGSTLIAQWSDGKVLVAEGANPKRIDLGFYPPSSSCTSTWWDVNTDGAKLLSNALLHVATASSCPPPVSYCTVSTTTNNCNPSMSSSGTPSVAATSGFTLTCNNVEGQKSGLLFYGINGRNNLQWGIGSTSFLCVKTPTQRMGSQNSGGTVAACDGVIAQDFLAFVAATPGALGSPFTAGTVVDAQCWFRDPPAVKTTNLSDGLEFTMCP